MYHILKNRAGYYLSENGNMVDSRADALHVDAATFRAFRLMGVIHRSTDLRIVTVTTRADRAARHVNSTSDPQSAQ